MKYNEMKKRYLLLDYIFERLNLVKLSVAFNCIRYQG